MPFSASLQDRKFSTPGNVAARTVHFRRTRRRRLLCTLDCFLTTITHLFGRDAERMCRARVQACEELERVDM